MCACLPCLREGALLSIHSTGRRQIEKMLITGRPHGCGSNFQTYLFNNIQSLVCDTLTRLLGEFRTAENHINLC